MIDQLLLQHYPFTLPPLPYGYDGLIPYIDEETMHYHYDKHFQNYINGLNQAIMPYPWLQNLTLEQLLSNPALLPVKARRPILQNGGGVFNHTLYFQGLSPANEGEHLPKGRLLNLIMETFGTFEDFKIAFTQSALGVFGSGWTALTLTPYDKLAIVNLCNQDTLLPSSPLPLLYVDVWEHAYYLKYKNQRAEYLNGIWNIITFPSL